jgi:hypothetical protein
MPISGILDLKLPNEEGNGPAAALGTSVIILLGLFGE